MARAHYALASEWHPCHLSSAWDVIWWPNLHFHRVAGRGIVFSSSRWGVWWWMMNNILPVVVFFFSFFSLSYYEKCMIVLFVFAISISVLIFF
jgi:lipoprotein signal peptidase